jgi:hypothetical protein
MRPLGRGVPRRSQEYRQTQKRQDPRLVASCLAHLAQSVCAPLAAVEEVLGVADVHLLVERLELPLQLLRLVEDLTIVNSWPSFNARWLAPSAQCPGAPPGRSRRPLRSRPAAAPVRQATRSRRSGWAGDGELETEEYYVGLPRRLPGRQVGIDVGDRVVGQPLPVEYQHLGRRVECRVRCRLTSADGAPE